MANIGGNFVNPAYASPQQIAALREYAKQLLTEQPVHHWAQGVGNIARALMGGYEARQADTQEQASNRALQEGLMEAVKTKDLSKLTALAGHPRMTPAGIAMLMGILEPRGTEQYGPGATYGGPAPSILEGAGGATVPPVSPVSRGQPLPTANAPTGEPARPGQDNITSGEVTGVGVQNIPPGVAPAAYVKQGFADAGITQKVPPKLQQAMPTLDVLQQKGQQYKNIEDINAKAIAANEQMKAAGMMAKPKMNTLSNLWQISQALDDSGWTPRLQKAFRDATGVMPPPNANKYELFDSLFKRLGPDAIQEAAASGRIPPALLAQYNERGPQIWQDKQTRGAIINSLAMPVDLHLRAAHIANQGGDPVQLQKKINSLEPYTNPLARREPTPDDIAKLKANPQYSTHFDAAFWPHTSDEYLGQQ